MVDVRAALSCCAIAATLATSGCAGATEVRRTWWPNGTLKSEASYRGEVLHGTARAWYASGQIYELRRYEDGRESGIQQSWTDRGELYLNYEVRKGRRFGFVNAKPCVPTEESKP